MKVFRFETAVNAKGGGFSWSETKVKRKPDRNAVRWYSTDADSIPLGPFPDRLKELIASHWVLTEASNSKLPRSFMSLGVGHFSGLQAVDQKLANVFEKFAGTGGELFKLPNFWSLTDKAEISRPYFFANVFAAEETIDIDASNARRVTNPRLSKVQPYSVGPAMDMNVKALPNFHTDHHVWRDRSTSQWFCSDSFKCALQDEVPGDYYFQQFS